MEQSKTNMTKKVKLKKSDEQRNNHKYRVAANITEYHKISKLLLLTSLKSLKTEY